MPSATVVQSGFLDDHQIAGTTLTFALTGVTVGNLIRAVAFCDSSVANITGVSGTVGDIGAYTHIGANVTDSANDGQMGQFYRYVTAVGAAGAITIVLTVSASSTFKGLYFEEVSGTTGGPQAASTIVNPTNPGTAANAITSGNLTPSAQPAIVLGVCVDCTQTEVPASGTGYTSLGSGWPFFFPPGNNSATGEWKRVTALTATPVTFTSSGAGGADHYLLAAAIFTEGTAAPPSGNGVFFGAGTTS